MCITLLSNQIFIIKILTVCITVNSINHAFSKHCLNPKKNLSKQSKQVSQVWISSEYLNFYQKVKIFIRKSEFEVRSWKICAYNVTAIQSLLAMFTITPLCSGLCEAESVETVMKDGIFRISL